MNYDIAHEREKYQGVYLHTSVDALSRRKSELEASADELRRQAGFRDTKPVSPNRIRAIIAVYNRTMWLFYARLFNRYITRAMYGDRNALTIISIINVIQNNDYHGDGFDDLYHLQNTIRQIDYQLSTIGVTAFLGVTS